MQVSLLQFYILIFFASSWDFQTVKLVKRAAEQNLNKENCELRQELHFGGMKNVIGKN